MKVVNWQVYIKARKSEVYKYLTEDNLRERFWVEKSETNGHNVVFQFPNGVTTVCNFLSQTPDTQVKLTYFDTLVEFDLQELESGTVLKLSNTGISDTDYEEILAGWVSVLLSLKAAVQFNVDIRNHDARRCWDQRFVEN